MLTKEQAELLEDIDLDKLVKPKTKVVYKKPKKLQKELDELQVSLREMAMVNAMLKNALTIVVRSVAAYGELRFEPDEAKVLNYVVAKYL